METFGKHNIGGDMFRLDCRCYIQTDCQCAEGRLFTSVLPSCCASTQERRRQILALTFSILVVNNGDIS